jgi:hypothetical protein
MPASRSDDHGQLVVGRTGTDDHPVPILLCDNESITPRMLAEGSDFEPSVPITQPGGNKWPLGPDLDLVARRGFGLAG